MTTLIIFIFVMISTPIAPNDIYRPFLVDLRIFFTM